MTRGKSLNIKKKNMRKKRKEIDPADHEDIYVIDRVNEHWFHTYRMA